MKLINWSLELFCSLEYFAPIQRSEKFKNKKEMSKKKRNLEEEESKKILPFSTYPHQLNLFI